MKLIPTPIILLYLLTPLLLPAQQPSIPVPEGAASRIVTPVVIVAPDRTAWTYAPGDPVTFSIEVRADGQLIPGSEIEYRIGPEKFEGDPVRVTVPTGRLTIGGNTMDAPGFLRCEVTTIIQGNPYKGMATAAFSPLEIEPTQVDPEDFDAFWEKQLALLEGVPLELKKTLLPERCTPDVNVYSVRYTSRSTKREVPFYGILTEPAKPGKYPAVLRVPGAGVRPYSGQIGLSEQGIVALEIGIHGIPVTYYDSPIYDNLKFGALDGYRVEALEDPIRYYFHRVYLGCVRANDVLVNHPMWDGETLVVCGGSQGGQLSMVVSALDKRVTGTVTNYPAYCDVTGYLHGRAGGWPHMFQGDDHRTEEKIRTTGYYDALNFARRLHAPISMAFGYNDVTCPPTSMQAAYNVIPVEKELHLQLEMGHGPTGEFSSMFTDRILRMAGVKD